MHTDLAKRALRLTPVLVVLAFFAFGVKEERRIGNARQSFRSFIRLMKAGQLVEAQREIDEAVRVTPQDANYVAHQALLREREVAARFSFIDFIRGESAFGEGDRQLLQEAANSYRQAITLNPYDDNYHHNLGWLLFFLNEPEQAAASIQEAIRIDSSNGLYHVSLGLMLERAQRADEARWEYAQALQLSPSLVDSPFFAELRARSFAEAEEILAGTVKDLETTLGPEEQRDPIIEAKLCRLYLAQGRMEKALAMSSRVLSDLPNLPRPWYVLGRVNELQHDDAQAEEYYRKATYLDATDALAALHLAQLYDRRQSKEEALLYYNQALKNWENQSSVHAGRVGRIYRAPSIPDDLVPKGLLAYCSPSLDAAQIRARIAQLEADIKQKTESR